MKTLFQIQLLLISFLLLSQKVSATGVHVISGDDVEVWVFNTCSASSASGKIDLRINSEDGPFQVIYYDENVNELKNISVQEGNGGEEDLVNLMVGDYRVKVISSNCTVVDLNINISVSPDLEINAELNPFCQVGTGKILPEIVGGQQPYTYLWSNGESTINIFNLDADEYTLTVTYGNGCKAQKTFYLDFNQNLILKDKIKTNSNCVLKDYPNGEIELSVLNGEPPYSFVWSDNKTGSKRSGLKVGNYSVTVTDQNGCSAEKKYYIPQSPAADQDIILSGTVTNASCGRRNGAIDLSIMSLVDIWVDVEWYMINPLLLFTDPIIGIKKERLFINNSFNMEDISNLPPGKYFVIVRALNGCSYMKDFTIENGFIVKMDT